MDWPGIEPGTNRLGHSTAPNNFGIAIVIIIIIIIIIMSNFIIQKVTPLSVNASKDKQKSMQKGNVPMQGT
jgi:hypothetical protein